MSDPKPVLVVVGSGGMGEAIAHRVGAGMRILLGDKDEARVRAVGEALTFSGHDVTVMAVDVTDASSVDGFAHRAAAEGAVTSVVHTAGVSPAGATVAAILAVDLLGTALVLDAFAPVVSRSGAGVFVASMAGHLAGRLEPEVEQALASTPTAELLSLPFLSEKAVTANPAWAYMLAKRGNQLRVRAAASAWGRRGARVNSISPGVISTGMGQAELAGEAGDVMRELIEGSPTGRIGTADDVAAATEFLLGPRASFVTGTDLLVDGGVVAATSG